MTIGNCSKCGGTHFGSDGVCPIASPEVVEFKRPPTEAEIADDIKRRLEQAFAPVLALMDEANSHGMMVHWDAVGPQPPIGRNRVVGLKLVKHY